LDISKLKDEDMRVLSDLYPTAKEVTEESDFFVGIESVGSNMDYVEA
jgi:hypothetical protein